MFSLAPSRIKASKSAVTFLLSTELLFSQLNSLYSDNRNVMKNKTWASEIADLVGVQELTYIIQKDSGLNMSLLFIFKRRRKKRIYIFSKIVLLTELKKNSTKDLGFNLG